MKATSGESINGYALVVKAVWWRALMGAMTVMLTDEGVQALKCDLCAHRQTGPACVAACPTQALRCIEPAELERLSAERRRWAAQAM